MMQAIIYTSEIHWTRAKIRPVGSREAALALMDMLDLRAE